LKLKVLRVLLFNFISQNDGLSHNFGSQTEFYVSGSNEMVKLIKINFQLNFIFGRNFRKSGCVSQIMDFSLVTDLLVSTSIFMYISGTESMSRSIF
jgi:hypothetical protein